MVKIKVKKTLVEIVLMISLSHSEVKMMTRKRETRRIKKKDKVQPTEVVEVEEEGAEAVEALAHPRLS